MRQCIWSCSKNFTIIEDDVGLNLRRTATKHHSRLMSLRWGPNKGSDDTTWLLESKPNFNILYKHEALSGISNTCNNRQWGSHSQILIPSSSLFQWFNSIQPTHGTTDEGISITSSNEKTIYILACDIFLKLNSY